MRSCSRNLHEKTMEQNRKHHRRRSRPANGPQAADTGDEPQRVARRQPSHHYALTSPPPALVSSPLLLLLLCNVSLALFYYLSQGGQVALAQQQQQLQPAQPNSFLVAGHNMENLRIPESQPVDSVVYQLKAVDPRNASRRFTYVLSASGEALRVDEQSGEVKLTKPLDREKQPSISAVISVFDSSDSSGENSLESKRRKIIVDDIDDSWPVFVRNNQSVTRTVPAGHYAYQVELSESAPVNSLVLADLQVTDADEAQNAEMVFECRPRQSTNAACDVFSVESRHRGPGKYSVQVRTRAQLDFERVQSYRLVVVARGRRASPLRGAPLESEATIQVNLVNEQDEGPQFVNAPYSLSMYEGLRQGTRLLNLIVQDGDSAPQRDLSIIIVPGPLSEYFQVTKDPELNKIWYLETNQTIDRENPLVGELGNMFTISLLAAELDEAQMPVASEAELISAISAPNYARGTLRKENVTVMVLDLADSRPLFVQASTGRPLRPEAQLIEISLSEATATGTSVPNLDLAVQDLDQGFNSRFNLSLVDGPEGPSASAAFALESEVIYGKAEIVLNVLNGSLIDYENPQLRVYRFTLVASKQSPQQELSAALEVQVNILDANDNAPEFERDQYVVEVPEGAAPGTLVATVRAQDRDSGPFGRMVYTLWGPGAGKFKLDPTEGRILVNDCGSGGGQCLDYETQPSYSLTYEARDGGQRVKNVSVLINVRDINDHQPRFTELVYKRELISDNLSSKQNYISPQLIVRAKDGDGPTQGGRNNLTYRIGSSNLTSLDVDPVSGLVYLSQPLDLDSVIAATGAASTAQDNKRIVFEAEVVAEDHGQPPQSATARILLTVKGNPEGAPQFRQDLYQVAVRESHPPGQPFLQVQAVDPDDKDSQLRYSLGYDPNDLTVIDPLTGQLAFKAPLDYDDFRGAPYNITVYATDNSRPAPLRASTLVSILVQDVNNRAPKFAEPEYKATLVQGRTRPGEVVLQVRASDPDTSAQLNYSIAWDQLSVHDRNGQQFGLDQLANSTSGYLSFMGRAERQQLVANLRRLFHVNRTSGAVELRAEPDYSFAASVTIVVRVQDLNQEQPATGLQQQPQQPQQSAQVACTFFLQTHVDKSPVFAPPWSIERRDYSISVMEEQAAGTPIFSLLAKEPASNRRVELFEKLHESDPSNYFRVERSGLVLVNRRLDYEELPAGAKRLGVSVKAVGAEGFYSVANLNVRVLDLNDNAPQFGRQNYSVTISEALEHPQEVLTVQAEDRDSEEFGRVHYSLSGHSAEYFAIDPARGRITVRRGVKLDRDSEPSHSLIVVARDCPTGDERSSLAASVQADSGLAELSPPAPPRAPDQPNCRKSSVLVNINLSDENDNEPIFLNVNKRAELEAVASETVSVGAVIAQVQAVDLDEGLNGQVSYEIVRSGADDPESRLVRIDREGYISVAEPLSGLGRAQPYRVQVRAFDHGSPLSRQSFASLLLTVSDVVANDGVPRFVRPKPDEVVLLSENTGPSAFVYQVKAVDPDEEETNGKLMYKFVQPTDVFEIDPFDGIIKTKFRPNFYLDREQVPNYTLIILAQDLGSPPKQAHQVLTVRITDVNDNEPYFERQVDDPPLVLYVEEEGGGGGAGPGGQLVGTIQARDRDAGANALIGYEIIDGNHNNLFQLSFDQPEVTDGQAMGNETQEAPGNNACRIYATGRLDREARDSYLLTIRASSMAKMRNPFMHQLKDPLGGRSNLFSQYNASDLSKIRVLIRLLDINDNRPVFAQPNAKSVVDSSAEVYSQLLVFKATDADSSSAEIHYSILEALYHSDARYRQPPSSDDIYSATGYQYGTGGGGGGGQQPAVSMRHVFDVDPRTGILRNSVPLRPYIDGYFEVFVKADSGQGLLGGPPAAGDEPDNHLMTTGSRLPGQAAADRCPADPAVGAEANRTGSPYSELESCSVAVAKATVFVTHQRETFRFVFNKTKLNDRLDEFKVKVQSALEELMFERPATGGAGVGQVQASTSAGQQVSLQPARAERVYLNTFNTDFLERDDGSLDFNSLTSCSQLVKFDDRASSSSARNDEAAEFPPRNMNSLVPNQVISYEEVLNLLKTLNATQTMRTQKGGQPGGALFSQYGLLTIERCLTDRALYRMSLSERAALYFAAMIAVLGALLAFIVSRMRKSYEKNLKLLQRSKYQYMNQYASLPPGLQAVRPSHHMSLAALQGATGNNFIAPPYGSHSDYEGPGYDTWQL